MELVLKPRPGGAVWCVGLCSPCCSVCCSLEYRGWSNALPPVCGISVALGWSVMSRYPRSHVDDIKVTIYAFGTSLETDLLQYTISCTNMQ